LDFAAAVPVKFPELKRFETYLETLRLAAETNDGDIAV